MNNETVNELITSLESAVEREQKFLKLAKAFKQVTAERDAALNAECVWEKTMMEVCGEDGPASVAAEIRNLRALRDTALQALKSQVEQLAAENVVLKESRNNLAEFIHEELDSDYPLNMNLDTPATDRIVAGIKADGVEMFVEKCREKSKQAISSDIRDNWWLASEHADDFAKQLRDGADK
ncbi:hypothetical protein [Klebsiella quasivariicola]|uniref:hypothetical protein n=1 Tax=Klebsiella quasivariicola TaxID=2026240 RepID=UPI0009BA604C|nr:hypothetical protein [Klebsiella quasivariicola]SLN99781.1 Uncharacterised protein [Klebsiella quasivariicola]